MNKIYPTAAAALADVVKDGQIIAVGGFGLCGIPEALIAALRPEEPHHELGELSRAHVLVARAELGTAAGLIGAAFVAFEALD